MSNKKDFSKILLSDRKEEEELKITIYPELQALIPTLTQEEIEGLEKSILSEGCREALLIWKNGEENILVDGHNRYGICQKHNIQYKTRFKEFESLDVVKDWMISNQLGRRNLTELQKSYLRGLQYNREKKKDTFKGNQHSGGGQNDHKQKTHEKLAEEHKVSPKTIQRDEKFALGLDKLTEGDKELKDKILNKTIKVPQSLVQEASEWDEKKVKETIKTIQKGNGLSSATKTEKSQEGTKESILKEINKKLKSYTYEELLEIKNNLK